MDALDLDVFEIWPVRRLEAKAMGQVIKLQSHAVVFVLFESHAANLDGHRALLHSRFCIASWANCIAEWSPLQRAEIAPRCDKRTVRRQKLTASPPSDGPPAPAWRPADGRRSRPGGHKSAAPAPAPRSQQSCPAD